MKKLLLIALLPLLGAASCEQKPEPDSKIPASLKTLCEDLPMLESGVGKDIVRWGVASREIYEKCKLRHEKLVKAIEATEK